MAKRLTVLDFFKKFPDEDTCLDHLMEARYGKRLNCPKCGKESTYHRIKKRPAYACQFCGNHIYPMAGTPFESTRTPLQMWFYAIYLFTTTKHGVPAKELQRQLGVTYKCAWRMGHEIRKYMGEVDGDDNTFSGHVEMDETFMGGRRNVRKFGCVMTKADIMALKIIVFGVVERRGRIKTYLLNRRTRREIEPHVVKHVLPGTTVSTDEARVYRFLSGKYNHGTVFHEAEQWVDGEHHTNTLECFWSHFKCAVRGTHRGISRKHMMKYLGEFEFRFNLRDLSSEMLDRLLKAFYSFDLARGQTGLGHRETDVASRIALLSLRESPR